MSNYRRCFAGCDCDCAQEEELEDAAAAAAAKAKPGNGKTKGGKRVAKYLRQSTATDTLAEEVSSEEEEVRTTALHTV